MEQIAFTMQLLPGCAEEYRRRHDALWPELAALLHEAGVRDYSIFLDERSLTLYAVQPPDTLVLLRSGEFIDPSLSPRSS